MGTLGFIILVLINGVSLYFFGIGVADCVNIAKWEWENNKKHPRRDTLVWLLLFVSFTFSASLLLTVKLN